MGAELIPPCADRPPPPLLLLSLHHYLSLRRLLGDGRRAGRRCGTHGAVLLGRRRAACRLLLQPLRRIPGTGDAGRAVSGR